MKNNRILLHSIMASSLVLPILPTISAQAAPSAKANPNASIHVNKTKPITKGQGNKRIENLVDAKATKNTKSLFAYLQDVRGKHVLFGHQHATDEGLTLTGTGEFESEVKNSVGDYPAVFGWDTLSLEGKEKPGVANDPKQSSANLAKSMKEAHEHGGIIALSTHFPNFVTGGSFNDTAGSVVENILPGGSKHAEFNAFLDHIASFANGLRDEQGELIPILFRPFHEQNGGWFWWGAKTTTASQYVELYRYTVEYLRDKKNVHNFLHVYSPNGTFGGNQENYLTTYPGDDYVDILGMDQYDNQANPGTEQFLNNLVSDLGMISLLADSKGKIAAFSEFGYSPQGMKTTGNGDLDWFTGLMDAIKADPDARRISYMQTWANFALNGNLFVPYKDAPNDLGDHELLPDFIKYYNDPYTSFLNEVEGVYDYKVKADTEAPFMHVVSPTASSTVTVAETTIRARVLNQKTDKVVYIDPASQKEVPMSLSDGYYSAQWFPAAEFNGKSADITVKSFGAKGAVQEQTVKVFVKVPEILIKKITFDHDMEGVQNNGTYPETISLSLSQTVLDRDGKLKIDVQGLKAEETWQELKLEFPEISKAVNLSDVKRVKFDVLLPASAADQNADASLRGIAMLPPDWDEKYGMATTEETLSDLNRVTLEGQEYVKYPVVIDLNDQAKSAAANSFALSLVGNGLEFDGAVYLDNIEFLNTYAEVSQDPAIVDDFEAYQGDSTLLGTKWVHAGGDATTVSLDGSNESGGTYGMKFDYTLGGSGYAGITKSLGDVDWSGANKLKFWLVPDGENQKMVVQLRVDGISYEAYPSLEGTTPRWEEIHFNQFKVAPWDTANAGKTLNKASLKNVQDFAVYVNTVDGATLSSSLYLDDIKAVNDGTGGVPNGGTGPGSTPEQPGILYDFESDVQGWGVEQNQANATSPLVTNAAAASGSNSLTSTFDLTKTGGFELTKVQGVDLSAVDRISGKVKLSAGTANVRLYIKTGTNWDWHDSGAVAVGSNEFKTLTINLDPAWSLDSVKSVGIKVEPVSGSGNAEVYVDEIALADIE